MSCLLSSNVSCPRVFTQRHLCHCHRLRQCHRQNNVRRLSSNALTDNQIRVVFTSVRARSVEHYRQLDSSHLSHTHTHTQVLAVLVLMPPPHGHTDTQTDRQTDRQTDTAVYRTSPHSQCTICGPRRIGTNSHVSRYAD